MTFYTQVLTFGDSPVTITPADTEPVAAPTLEATHVYAEPLDTNVHICYVGVSSVTNDGTGTGAIAQLGTTGPSIVFPSWSLRAPAKSRLDLAQIYFHGFMGESVLVTFIVDRYPLA